MAATRNDAGAWRAEALILQRMGGAQRSIKSITDSQCEGSELKCVTKIFCLVDGLGRAMSLGSEETDAARYIFIPFIFLGGFLEVFLVVFFFAGMLNPFHGRAGLS